MAKDSHNSAAVRGVEKTGGKLSGLFADENEFDRRTLWRLGWWGAGAVGAVGLAIFASQTAQGWRRDRVSAADLSRQTQLIQSLAKETQGEARQLAAAIETLNTDRDRLYARVTVLEQGLDSVTGALAKQTPPQAAASPAPNSRSAPPPAVAAVESQPPSPSPSPASPSPLPAYANMSPFMAAPTTVPGAGVGRAGTTASPAPAPSPAATPATASSPAPAAAKPPDADKIAKAEPADSAGPTDNSDSVATAVQKTEFAVDLGGANSIGGLRTMWRGLSKTNADLAALRPIIILKEGQSGPGMQLRLGAGPLSDAAAAARICATLTELQRTCETTVYDGQRLSLRDEPDGSDAAKSATPAPAAQKPPVQRRRTLQPQALQQRHGKREEPPPPPAAAAPAPPPEAPKPEQPSALSSFFRRS